MGDQGRVTACESYLPMVKLMKKVLRLNGMDGRIRVINKRSDELHVGLDLPSRANVLVSGISKFSYSYELLSVSFHFLCHQTHRILFVEYIEK